MKFGAKMSRFIDLMTAARANAPDQPPWPRETVENPTWDQVEHAIRRLDQVRYTAVELHRIGDRPEEEFCIIGGAGQWYIVDSVLRFEYDDPSKGDDRVSIWKDMDMECKRRNLLTDIENVVRIAKQFFKTGSYKGLAKAIVARCRSDA
jgi:hypothetical protein